MRKWFTIFFMSAALAAPVYAQQPRTQLMTAPEMISAAQAVKNAKTQPLLEKWVRVCLQKEWGNCQVAWWNLVEQGGLTQMDNEGYSSWGFLKQPDANEVLMHLVAALNVPPYRSAWNIEVTTTKQYADIPNIVEGQNALTDGADQVIVLAIIQERFTVKNVAYQMNQEMPTKKMEWLRLVALMYAVRDDAASSYQVLTELQKHAKITQGATDTYNRTVQAVQAYIKKGASK